MKKLALPLLAVAISLFGGVAAHAQMPTVIDRLPYTITARGFYVLNSDLSSSQTTGNLITISANNVIIDLQGHFISGPVGDTSQTTYGIYAYERNNITVKNGTVANLRYGLYFGVASTSTTNNIGHELEHLRVSHCSSIGIYLYQSSGSSVTNCKVSEIGYSGGGLSYGIYMTGEGSFVLGCLVTNRAYNSNNLCTGIYGSFGTFMRQNMITSFRLGISGGKYQDNLFDNCYTAFANGIDAGGNN